MDPLSVVDSATVTVPVKPVFLPAAVVAVVLELLPQAAAMDAIAKVASTPATLLRPKI
jgi:hypothetical protein